MTKQTEAQREYAAAQVDAWSTPGGRRDLFSEEACALALKHGAPAVGVYAILDAEYDRHGNPARAIARARLRLGRWHAPGKPTSDDLMRATAAVNNAHACSTQDPLADDPAWIARLATRALEAGRHDEGRALLADALMLLVTGRR